MQTPFLNADPFQQWYGVENVARVRVNGESCMALLNNGAQINTIMPSFVKTHSLEVGPLSDLIGRWVACVGLGDAFTQPLGYMIIWAQVVGVQGYDEDWIALVNLDLSDFAVWVPVILGTPKISCIINIIKEKEIDALTMPWVNAWVAHLLSVWRAAATVKDGQTTGNSNLGGYNEMVLIRNTETIDAFSSHVITAKANADHTSKRIDRMTQALCVEDSSLPQGLMVQNAYKELRKGSKNIVMKMRNSMAYSQTLREKTVVARTLGVTRVPEPLVKIGLMGVMGELENNNHQMPKLIMKQRQEKSFEELDLSRLESWPSELVASTWSLLAEYHDIFSPEPSEHGCTHSTEHVIKVTDETPFIEQFRWIPPTPHGGGSSALVRNVGFRHDLPQPECVV